MTEQFSQEYKAFMQSDEAKGLQALWVPAAGDWVLLTHRGEGVPNCLGTMDDRKDWVDWAREALKYRDVTWLPTLFQLIRVIEGAGYDWKLQGSMRRKGTRVYSMSAEQDGPDILDYLSEIDKDLVLAAAQLAVRAVEEKA